MENIVPSWPGIHHEDPSVYFTFHDIEFELLKQHVVASWLMDAIEAEGHQAGRIDYIFCSDAFLIDINRNHLGHDEYTDIITFPLEEDPVVGEIYISIDRVRENAQTFEVPFERELYRVMIHGILHLCGYDDHEDDDIAEIRAKEEEYISRMMGSSS